MYCAATRAELSRCLADAFLAGPWDPGAAAGRARIVLDRRPRWVGLVIGDVFAAYHRPPADRPRELAAFIAAALARRPAPTGDPPRVRRWLVPEPAMGRRPWPVPDLASVGALAGFLGLDAGQLAWLADTRSLERGATVERLRNYRYTALPRPGRAPRVIERPKARLKAAQRRLLHEVLDWIPAHDAAHGFTRGRSAVSHARRHAGRFAVLRVDLEDFFASVSAGRVYGIFRTAGYPEAVAHALTGLTTNALPPGVWLGLPRPAAAGALGVHHRLGRRLAAPHLPQGAPTSPALANLAAFGLDRRLAGLARGLGLTYSRYADDLTFSGSELLVRRAGELRARIGAIVVAEGFRVNEGKSMLTTRAGRQQTCGIVVNAHPNVSRGDYDRLRAVLHDAGRRGPEMANRGAVPDFRAHLAGRIAWVAAVNPARAERLRRAFAAIEWG